MRSSRAAARSTSTASAPSGRQARHPRPRARARSRADAAREGEQQTAALYAMSRDLASTRGVDELLKIAVRHVSEVFRSQIVVVVPDGSGHLAPRSAVPDQLALDESDLAVARW